MDPQPSVQRWAPEPLRDAGMSAAAVLVGYATGIAVILLRLWLIEDDGTLNAGSVPGVWLAPIEPYAAELLVFRYPEHRWTDPGVPAGTLMWLLVAAFIGVCISRVAPLRWAPGRMHEVPDEDRREALILWRGHLREARPPVTWLVVLGVGAGLAGAVLGDLIAVVSIAIEREAAWAMGTPGAYVSPRPVCGLWTAADMAWCIAAAAVLPAAVRVFGARGRALRCSLISQRWCLRCGYPRPRPHDGAVACSECGAPATIPTARRGSRLLWLMIAVAIWFVLLAVDALAPSLVTSLIASP